MPDSAGTQNEERYRTRSGGDARAEQNQSTPTSLSVAAAPEATRKPLYETVMAQMVGVLAALTIFCGVITLAHFFLIRRYGTSIFPLFRVEVVARPPDVREGPLPTHYPGFGSPPVDPTRDRGQVPFDQLFPAEPTEEGPIQPNFEIGPTYEEELALRQEAEIQKESAVIQHIVELNRQLQEQLQQLESSDTSLPNEQAPAADMENGEVALPELQGNELPWDDVIR